MLELLIIGGGVAATSIGLGLSEVYEDLSNKWNDYWRKKDRDNYEELIENIHQEQHEKAKERHAKYDKLREQYKLKERKKLTIYNDTEKACKLIFVNPYFLHDENYLSDDNSYKIKSNNNEKLAIEWAKKIINGSIVDGFFNSTRITCLNKDEELEILTQQYNEYFIVVKYQSLYQILTSDIRIISELFKIKKEEIGEDIGCRFPFI